VHHAGPDRHWPNETLWNIGDVLSGLMLASSPLSSVSRFTGYELAELGWRNCKYRAAQVGDPRLDRGVGEAHVHLPSEHANDRGGRALGRAEPEPAVPG